MPDTTWPGHSGVYQWGIQWELFGDQKTAREEQTFSGGGLWALHVKKSSCEPMCSWHSEIVSISPLLVVGMFSCAGHSTAVILSTAQQILWRIQTYLARHLSDTSVLITKQQWELWMPFFFFLFLPNSIAVEKKVMNKYKVEKRINFTESGQSWGTSSLLKCQVMNWNSSFRLGISS